MKVKATTVMARELNKEFKRRNWDYKAMQVKLTRQEYGWYVGNAWDAEDYGDYDYKTDTYRALVVVYPDEDYACNKYISSEELNQLFNKGMSLEEFMNTLADCVEI